jgi:regulator of protease activity HflC (stomatin/prohibitin superfamily)
MGIGDGIVEGLKNLINKITICGTVDKYEGACMFRMGSPVPWRLSLTPEEKKKRADERRKVRFHTIKEGENPYSFNYKDGEGVEYNCGKPIKSFRLWHHPYWYRKELDLRAGFYWNWPVIDRLAVIYTKVDTATIDPVCILTTDNDPNKDSIMVGAVAFWNVKKVSAALVETKDHEQFVKEKVRGELSDLAIGHPYDYWKSKSNVEEFRTDLMAVTNRKISPYGLEVIDLRLTDLVPPKIYKIFGPSHNFPVYPQG